MKRLLLIAASVVLLAAAWRFTPLAAWTSTDQLLAAASSVGRHPAAPFLVPVLYVALGLAMFPIMALRLLTIVTFGPVLGPVYAVVGSVASAMVGHTLGRLLGEEAVARHAGERFQKVRAFAVKSGVVTVAALRMIPLGPFMLVNAAAGAAGIRLHHFVAGTALGMIPGLLLAGTVLSFLQG